MSTEQDKMQAAIVLQCDEIKDFLLAKNKAYGNSASSPARVFSSADTKEQLAVRMDDKLSRIRNLTNNPNVDHLDESLKDTKIDLIGYLILELAIDNVTEDAADNSIWDAPTAEQLVYQSASTMEHYRVASEFHLVCDDAFVDVYQTNTAKVIAYRKSEIKQRIRSGEWVRV